MDTWKYAHKNAMVDFLKALNHETKSFILKGGTCLLLAYGLNRFSEDIDLDGGKQRMKGFMKRYCQKKGFSYRIAKDTPTVERFMVDYTIPKYLHKPLKIEISYRSQNISPTTHVEINGIEVYTIDRLCQLKTMAYQGRDKIRDLYDVCFICDRYFASLSEGTKNQLRDALSYKGFEHYDYITSTQKDPLIDKNTLADLYLQMFDKLNLLYTTEEAQSIQGGKEASKPLQHRKIHER